MRWLSRLVTAAVFAILAVVAVIVIARVTAQRQVGGHFRTYALFRDAAGLPVGSRVVIAGVNVGHINALGVEGNQARVSMVLRDDVAVWDDAWATKKSSSALGDNYLEIAPGGPDPADPPGTPLHRRLRSGEPIPRVVESPDVDATLRAIEQGLPRIDDNLAAANGFIDEGRQWVNGDLVDRVNALDRRLAAGALSDPIDQIDRALDRADDGTARAADAVERTLPAVRRRMDTLPGDIAVVTGDLRDANHDFAGAMADARARIDTVDKPLQRAAELVDELNGAPGEKQGRLARLVNDPSLGDTIADTAEGLAEFTGTLDRLKTTVGFKFEQNLISRQPRFYVTAELRARADQFYLIEALKGPEGDRPEVTLTDAPGSATWTRRTQIEERIKFTAQWGKHFGPVAIRLGIKESQFGIGADTKLNKHLELSLDAIESSFSRIPRIKLAAALEVFHDMYVLAGVDDALTPSGEIPIRLGNDDVPIQFNDLPYGRDYYLGANLKFTDADLNRLLLIYGALLGGIIK